MCSLLLDTFSHKIILVLLLNDDAERIGLIDLVNNAEPCLEIWRPKVTKKFRFTKGGEFYVV